MFTLQFTNVDNPSRTFPSLRAAIEAGRRAGFEFSVWQGSELLVSWSVFGGTHFHTAAALAAVELAGC